MSKEKPKKKRKKTIKSICKALYKSDAYYEKDLDQAVNDIKVLLLEKLPKEKEILQPAPTAYRYGKTTAHGIWLYNQTLADVRKVIEEV